MKKGLFWGTLLLLLSIAFWEWRAGNLLIARKYPTSVVSASGTSPQAHELAGLPKGAGDQGDPADESDLPAFDPGDAWYEQTSAFSTSAFSNTSNYSLNRDLIVGLGVSTEQLKSLSNCLLPVAIKLNAKSAVEVSDGFPSQDPGRPGYTAYRITQKTPKRAADAATGVLESFKAILGDKRGSELFRRVSRAAEGDPYLRGFGSSTLILYMQPPSTTGSPHVRWEYEVYRVDGSFAGRGKRNSFNSVPLPFQELFHTEDDEAGSSEPIDSQR